MIFGIIIVSIFAILAILCFVVVIMALKENIKDKKRGKKPVLQADFITGMGILGLFIFIISLSLLAHTFSPNTNNTNKEQNYAQCQVCGKEFQKGSENAKSIRKTNMCIQCYENYINATDALKELPIN